MILPSKPFFPIFRTFIPGHTSSIQSPLSSVRCNNGSELEGRGMSVPAAELKRELELLLPRQSHVLRHWDELTEAERLALAQQIRSLDVNYLNNAFHASLQPSIPRTDDISQPPGERYFVRDELGDDERRQYYERGLEAIANGQVAAIVLAGGQASRLGATNPKGTLKLGLGLSQRTDSLLMFQAAQIVRLIALAKEKFPGSQPSLLWVLMSSESTTAETTAHLNLLIDEVRLRREDVLVFTQKQIPSFDMDGNFMMSSKATIATSPDGNGGIYESIKHLLPVFESRGIKYFHVYCVDNILCKVADPHFVGCSIEKDADSAAKVIEKKEPTEAVGHVCIVNGHVKVVEYSEITKELAEKRDASGKLYLRAGSIANHFFTLEFLKLVCLNSKTLPFHGARKKINHVDVFGDGHLVRPTSPNGIKLEKFIFDAFHYSRVGSFLIWQVDATKEFSPLKNADSAGKDCMSTCRRDLAKNHRKWLENAGLLPTTTAAGHDDAVVFISPIVSYEGEGLSAETVPVDKLREIEEGEHPVVITSNR